MSQLSLPTKGKHCHMSMGPLARWIFLIFCVGMIIYMIRTKRKNTWPENSEGGREKFAPAPALKKDEEFNTSINTPNGMKNYEEIETAVFRPLGFKIREPTLIPSLDFLEQPHCPKIFADWLKGSEHQDEAAAPPRDIPDQLYDNYTLSGYLNIIRAYMDNRSGTQKAVWTKEVIDRQVAKDVREVANYDGEGRGMYYAMREYNVSGKKGMVVGSLSPWVEGFALKLGASHVTTVEYMKISVTNYDRLNYFHPLDIARSSSDHIEKYDFIASFSSLEHAGLGRFGDALDPFGDFKEALKVYCMLKKDGYFFISLPTGEDTLHWNLHRVYGRIRYALFAGGFDVVDMFYRDGRKELSSKLFEKPNSNGGHTQPVLVLRKR